MRDVDPEPPQPLTGPAFGTYPAEDVRWLLTDLSHVQLEAPLEEREDAIQAGRAHYAESLPIEYQPDAEYRALFDRALAASARRLAFAVGLVTEQILALREEPPVLASLARAGTPVGVLMRRWLRFAHGLEVPHYAVSIVRGRGIDRVALRYLATAHRSSQVLFVDGWTGKGAIKRELHDAVGAANADFGTGFPDELAVLADTGSCTELFGTRDDFLIPSACLNSTVSGLVSRTVLNPDLIAPHAYHGAKFYADLRSEDVSMRFIRAVEQRFEEVAAEVTAALPAHLASDRRPRWSGWREVTAIGERYGLGNEHLIKPGVGETTRVLLRRVPWRILVRSLDDPELAHVRLLADRRGVELVEVPDLGYRCVGLVAPAAL